MKKVKVTKTKETGKLKSDRYQRLLDQTESIDSRALMMQTLIPLGLKAVEDILQEEVDEYSQGT